MSDEIYPNSAFVCDACDTPAEAPWKLIQINLWDGHPGRPPFLREAWWTESEDSFIPLKKLVFPTTFR